MNDAGIIRDWMAFQWPVTQHEASRKLTLDDLREVEGGLNDAQWKAYILEVYFVWHATLPPRESELSPEPVDDIRAGILRFFIHVPARVKIAALAKVLNAFNQRKS